MQDIRKQHPADEKPHSISYEETSEVRTGTQHQSRTAEAIQAWLTSYLSELLDLEAEAIDVRNPIASYGLGSLQVVSMSGALQEWLGRRLFPAIVWDYPTIETLAHHLAEEPAPGAD